MRLLISGVLGGVALNGHAATGRASGPGFGKVK
jgi:hypothetical protein